jgi:ABC-type Mn2+/Zn2+ transport system permease subunit
MSELLAGTPLEVIPGATVAALIAGTLLPLLGMWVVLQRVVFLGIALSQVAAAGVALGLLFHLPPLFSGFVLCLLVVLFFTARRRRSPGTGGDSALGAAFCIASALALLFVSRSPAEMDQVEHVLYGNLIFASRADVNGIAVALVGGLVVLGLFFPRILLSTFDGETAAALGLRPRAWLLLLFGVLAVVLTFSMRTTGAVLTFALLILPPMAALRFGRGLRGSFALAALLGFLGTLAGLLLAVSADLHLESSIIVACFLLLPVARAWQVSPLLGVVLAGALVALAPLLAPDESPPRTDQVPVTVAEPWHLDVHLSARRTSPHAVEVAWTLDVHWDDADVALPPALWLTVSGEGVSSDRVLVPDTAVIEPGETLLSGRFVLDDAELLTRLEGQLWTAPPTDLEALPVDGAAVLGCSVP